MEQFRYLEEGAVGPEELRRSFARAAPFPHVVLDGFLRAEADEVLPSFPDQSWSGWHRYKDEYQRGKMVCRDIELIPEPFTSMIHELSSPSFLSFLEQVTGIKALIPDPFLDGGGLHCSGAGGILAPHTDFHIYPRLNLYRRLNVLVYLNPDWEVDWGGCLELYASPEDATPAATVVPRWGRCVIFRTDDRSVHGFSQPIAADRWRRSLALYYYTSTETESFSGDRSTHWRRHGSFHGVARLQFEAYRALLLGSRALSVLAHRVNPNIESRAQPK